MPSHYTSTNKNTGATRGAPKHTTMKPGKPKPKARSSVNKATGATRGNKPSAKK